MKKVTIKIPVDHKKHMFDALDKNNVFDFETMFNEVSNNVVFTFKVEPEKLFDIGGDYKDSLNQKS
jgi:hypothetical protein